MEIFRYDLRDCVVIGPLLGLTWIWGAHMMTNRSLVMQIVFSIVNTSLVDYPEASPC
jgi:hypothetical protein